VCEIATSTHCGVSLAMLYFIVMSHFARNVRLMSSLAFVFFLQVTNVTNLARYRRKRNLSFVMLLVLLLKF
jgi:hypothetical protein